MLVSGGAYRRIFWKHRGMEGLLRVPGYAVERRLGSPGSSMWLGTDEATGQPVTLRLVQDDVESLRAALSTAVLVMRAIQHPHVLPFHDMIETPEGSVLVLGAAEGGSLADIFYARRVLSPGEMVTACAPIAEALAEIHRHGIVHGAITPDEIVFARDGRPMLAGVGLATIGANVNLQELTIAPEVASGAEFGPPADVYGVAATAIVALTGPVSADRLFAASAEQLLATGVTPAAQAVVTRAIGRNVGRRPDAETLVNALYVIADPEPVELVISGDEPAPPASPPLQAGPAVQSGPPFVDPYPDRTAAFGGPSGDAEELDDVTAYMRQTSAPGRRGRRAGSSSADTGPAEPGPTGGQPGPERDGAPTETAGAGRRDRTRRSARTERSEHSAQAAREERSDHRVTQPTGRDTNRSSPPGRSAQSPSGSRRPSRRDLAKVASVLVVLLLAAGAVVLGMQIFGGDDQLPEAGLGTPDSVEDAEADLCGGPRPAPEEEPPEVTDWTQEVQRLYNLRAQAFEEINAELLCEAYSPQSDSLVRDVQLLQEYVDQGVRTRNLSFEVIDVELVEQNGGTVVLEISDRVPPYQLVDENGEVVEEKPGMDNDTWTAELGPIADSESVAPTWRFFS